MAIAWRNITDGGVGERGEDWPYFLDEPGLPNRDIKLCAKLPERADYYCYRGFVDDDTVYLFEPRWQGDETYCLWIVSRERVLAAYTVPMQITPAAAEALYAACREK
jgi:hypothetical protein